MSRPPTDDEDGVTHQSQVSKPKVIIPPPEIKAVIDKTASYVAKNGVSFEQLINKVEANNPKFNFLRHHEDPYRPYYISKL
jgi:splicing factor 3A subunit 1